MAATSVRANSVAMDEPNDLSEIQTFMEKYEKVDKDRKKYMICFFALFALVIIFLVIILVGLTSTNSTTKSNIDTCHADCGKNENDFVTLTESDTDTPIATYNGWLDVYLQNASLTNYSRILTNNGTIIYDLDTYLYELKESLGLEDKVDQDVYISIIYQIFQGNVEYDYLVKSCNILYTGHSLFTVRGSSDNSLSTTKYVSDLQITSEQCDDEISNGLPTSDTFEINDNSYVVECLYGDSDKCQIYKQYTQTLNLRNMTFNTTTRRRLFLDPIDVFPKDGKCDGVKCEDGKTYVCNDGDTTTNKQCCNADPDNNQEGQCCGAGKTWNCVEQSCFPSGTTVNTRNGVKFIQDLNIGDEVLTINSYTNELEYSHVYMYGRKIANTNRDFITLYTNNSDLKVSATPSHFIYVCENKDGSNCKYFNGVILKRFKDIIVGKDYIFDDKMNKYLVINKEYKNMDGVYSPYTLNGNIIVNGIISSCYSDSIFDNLLIGEKQYESYLPFLFQIMTAPLRCIYSLNPSAWKLFNSLYPYGLSGAYNVNIFDILKQVYWSLFVQQS